MRILLLLAAVFAAAGTQLPPGSKAPGPEVGARIPPFRLVDQHGREQTFESVRGSQGGLLVFYRSADW